MCSSIFSFFKGNSILISLLAVPICSLTNSMLSRFSRVWLCVTPQTAAHQAPPSLGFSRQEHWNGSFPSPMHESEKWKWSHSVMSDSSRPHGLQPTSLLPPWDFPGKSTAWASVKNHLGGKWLPRMKVRVLWSSFPTCVETCHFIFWRKLTSFIIDVFLFTIFPFLFTTTNSSPILYKD